MDTVLHVHLHPEVRDALAAGGPVVALESTVISHGLPYPQNLDIARRMEAAIRKGGAVPATIGVLGGRVTVGLDASQMEHLATASNVRKCSRRDLPIVGARGEDGATTVAGTMIVAHLAGIRVFATGGIGGVHRGHPFDVSSDLTELGRTPVAVVCAGAKSILDIPLTLEVLETQGVPVLGWQTSEFPSFFSRTSGFGVDVTCRDAGEVAAILRERDRLKLSTGSLVVCPVPAEFELPAAEAEAAITKALQDAEAQGVRGKAVTPFLLARVSALTGDASRRANLALLENNAGIAARIAVALSGRV